MAQTTDDRSGAGARGNRRGITAFVSVCLDCAFIVLDALAVIAIGAVYGAGQK